MKTYKHNITVFLVLIAIFLGACQPTQAVSTPEQPEPVASATQALPEPAATENPAPTTEPENGVSYASVSFELDPAVATGITGTTVPENPGSADGPYWEALPEYRQIALDGYPLTDTFHQATISVYPVARYRELNPQADRILNELQALLSQKPADADQIPALPVVNAGQVFHANLAWMDFQNGSGARFLTIYAQYPAPVNNYDLIYSFQGLTADGSYVVSITLPVNHPSLRASLNAFTTEELDAIVADYDGYRAQMANDLSAQASDSFTPDLANLDALVASLSIEP